MKRVIKATTFTKEQMWDMLIENGIATEEELQLVTDVALYDEETLEAVLYSRTGDNDFNSLVKVG